MLLQRLPFSLLGQRDVARSRLLLNLFLGGGEDRQIRVIDGQAREVGKLVRIAGEAIMATPEPAAVVEPAQAAD